MHGYQKLLVNNCPTLKEFNYNLATVLFNSSFGRYFQNVLVESSNRRRATVGDSNYGMQDDTGTERNPDTLAE